MHRNTKMDAYTRARKNVRQKPSKAEMHECDGKHDGDEEGEREEGESGWAREEEGRRGG